MSDSLTIHHNDFEWTAYYDPEGLTGHGATSQGAVQDLLEKMYEAWGKAMDERDEARRSISHSPYSWVRIEDRMPDNEQTVLACWHGSSVCNEGMETLSYHAADAPDGGECWRDVFGEMRDPPTHWTLMEMPK